MRLFWAALGVEWLKARRAWLPWVAAAGFLLLPIVDGLFMIILKDPEAARQMGIIGIKAELTAGTADWNSLFGILNMGTSIAGLILYAIVTSWIFGREFANQTAKELLALPTPRKSIVLAKFTIVFAWVLGVTLVIFLVGMGIGFLVRIPGWSSALAWASLKLIFTVAVLTFMLMPLVAFIASAFRSYLPALGWAFLSIALGQIMAVLGWGPWFPWSVPATLTEFMSETPETLHFNGLVSVFLVFLIGIATTLRWWQRADHAY